MKQILRVIVAIVSIGFALVISGCASTKLDSYVSPSFSAGQTHRVAVMPLSNQRINAGQAIELNRALIQKMQRGNPRIEVVGGQDAIAILNQQNLADTWTNFLIGYSTSGLPTKLKSRIITKTQIETDF